MENFNRTDALVFVHALRKIAATPDADLVEHEQAVATGQASTPEEAMQRTLSGQPDPSVRYEGDYAVPPEQIVPVLAQIVSNSMRQHTAYSFYAEMIRGAGRGELAELFEEQGAGELKEMAYFLRRISILSPGGVPIPVAPTPAPTNDVGAALKYLIAGEQQALVLFKTLRSMLGDNPMKYMVEQIMTDSQEHHDKLLQNLPAEKPKSKVASVIAKLSAGVPIGAPGTEPAEVVAQREAMLQQQQMAAENQALRAQVDQMGQVATQQQQQLESMGAENQNLQAQSQMASDQAHMATEQAQVHAEQAANEADAKMRLSIRIQQMRQSLADTVAQDPVQEEGVGFGNPAGPGTIQTQTQNNAMAQEAAAMDPTAGTGAAPTQEAAKQQGEAAGAQQEAKKQTAQAQAATKQASAPKGLLQQALEHGTEVIPTTRIRRTLLMAGSAGLGAAIGERNEREKHEKKASAITPAAKSVKKLNFGAAADHVKGWIDSIPASAHRARASDRAFVDGLTPKPIAMPDVSMKRPLLAGAAILGGGTALGLAAPKYVQKGLEANRRRIKANEKEKKAGDYTEGLRLMARAKKADCGVPTVGEVNNGDPKPPHLPLAGMGTEVETRDPQRVDPETSKQYIVLAKRKV